MGWYPNQRAWGDHPLYFLYFWCDLLSLTSGESKPALLSISLSRHGELFWSSSPTSCCVSLSPTPTSLVDCLYKAAPIAKRNLDEVLLHPRWYPVGGILTVYWPEELEDPSSLPSPKVASPSLSPLSVSSPSWAKG